MKKIFGKLLAALLGLDPRQPLEVLLRDSLISPQPCRARRQHEAEEMLWLLSKNRIRFGRGERRVTSHFGESPQVVSLIDGETSQRLVRLQRHRHEEPHAVCAPPLRGAHDTIVQSLGPLRR